MRCMEPKCTERVPWNLFQQFSSTDELREKARTYIMKNFVEQNPLCKWCPTPDCPSVIMVKENCLTIESASWEQNVANANNNGTNGSGKNNSKKSAQNEIPSFNLLEEQKKADKNGKKPANPAAPWANAAPQSGGGTPVDMGNNKRMRANNLLRGNAPVIHTADGGGVDLGTNANNDDGFGAKISNFFGRGNNNSGDSGGTGNNAGASSSSSTANDVFCMEVDDMSPNTRMKDSAFSALISREVDCTTCSYKWCFACNQEAHRGITCGVVKKWMEKNQDEAENVTWIIANTKSCPKCKYPIEKNSGCMHMVCRCGFQFCWLCGADDTNYKHTRDGRPCNKFLEQPTVEVETSRKNLARYAHYFERYRAHHGAQGIAAKKTLKEIREKMETIQQMFGNWNDVLFLEEAIKQVIECRRFLKWTYAFGFFADNTEFFNNMLSKSAPE